MKNNNLTNYQESLYLKTNVPTGIKKNRKNIEIVNALKPSDHDKLISISFVYMHNVFHVPQNKYFVHFNVATAAI